MYFEATLRKRKIGIDVNETSSQWVVSVQEEGQPKELHRINKSDYKYMDDAVNFLFMGSSYMVDVIGSGLDYTVYTRGSFRSIRLLNDETLLHESLKKGSKLGGANELVSGMPGKIVHIFVKPGETVKMDQPLLVMEAMKMENEIRASANGVVKSVNVEKGISIESGQLLMTFEITAEEKNE
jgi:biotin carboxyl carrier protein